MTWAEPWWGILLPVIAGLILVVWFARARHLSRLGKIFSGAMLDRVLPRPVRLRRQARDALAITGLLCLVMALVEPRFGKAIRELTAEGVDVVLVVDVSRSMDAQDVDPSRLERARREILDLLGLLEGDRVGLVMYAGGAYPRMPLTLDYKALQLVVGELDTRVFQAQGSALGLALREGLKLLANQRGEAGQAIVVLSDGEVHEPDDAIAAANEAATAGVPVYGMVIGSAPAPIPNGDGTFLQDGTAGGRVLTTPSSETLTEVARITGGAVVQSVAGNEDVVALYRDQIRGRLRATVARRAQRETWNTAYQWPLGVGLLLLLAASWLGDGKRTVALTAVLLAVLAAPAARAEGTARDGDVAYRAQHYDEAVRIFTDLTLEHPDDPELFGRLGAARYRAGDFVGAARAFDRQAELGGQVDAEFNAGNAYYRSGQLDRAIERYDDVLRKSPDHPGASANKELLLQEMTQRQQVQQQSQPPPQQGDKGDESEEGEQEGEPQQGGQGAGEPQDGEPDDKPKGDPQQGSPESGQESPEGQPPQSDPQDPSSSSSGQEQQREPEDDQGERAASPADGEQGPQEGQEQPPGLDELSSDDKGDGEGGEQGEATGEATEPSDQPGASGGMTPEQAGRVLDGVEEGRPRVYIPGERGGKPW